jgi:hypothetical protein
MSYERRTSPSNRRPYEVFGFSKEECLDGRVNQERFKEILDDEQTTVHSVEESDNNYGEFLFVTVSRLSTHQRLCMTFFGLGFHQYRERWFTDEWFWYQTPSFREVVKQNIVKEETYEKIQQRFERIDPEITSDTQTDRGRLFEMLANLTDEDGAYAELQELGSLSGWLAEELPDQVIDDQSAVCEKGGESVPEQTSQIVKAGARTYFLDLKETRDGKPYLVITESRFKGEDKERERTSIALFPENAQDFLQALQEMVSIID